MEAYGEEDHDVVATSQLSNEQFDTMAIPVGYRFKPTDEELIIHYLARKILEMPLSYNTLKEVDLYSYTPHELEVAYGPRREKEMYFFTKNKLKHANGSRPSREARDGFWRASTDKKPIKVGDGDPIGYKMLLNYRSNTDRKKNTDWLMYEYSIKSDTNKMDGYVLCKVYNKGHKQEWQINAQPEEPRKNMELEMQPDHTANLYYQNAAQQVPQTTPDYVQDQDPCYDNYLRLDIPSFDEPEYLFSPKTLALIDESQADYQAQNPTHQAVTGIDPYEQNAGTQMQQIYHDYLQRQSSIDDFFCGGLDNQNMELDADQNKWDEAINMMMKVLAEPDQK